MKAKMATEALQACGSLNPDRSPNGSAGLLGWNSASVGPPCPETFYPYQPIPQLHPQSPSPNSKRPRHKSSSAASLGLSPKRRRIGDTGPCGSGAQMISHGIIVLESALPSSSDATSLTVDAWGQAHALRINNTHMTETPENTLNGRPRAEGLLAMAHPMEPSPVRQPRDCTGMPGPSATALGQEPTLSNGPQQPPLSQHGTASLLSAELDSGAFFLEQDEIVPAPSLICGRPTPVLLIQCYVQAYPANRSSTPLIVRMRSSTDFMIEPRKAHHASQLRVLPTFSEITYRRWSQTSQSTVAPQRSIPTLILSQSKYSNYK